MSSSGLAAVAELGDLLGVDVLNPRPDDWLILTNKNSPAIVPDTVPRFEYRNEARISDYPLEQGAFASYNKVQVPYDIRMMMVCAGANYIQGAAQKVENALNIGVGKSMMSRQAFIDSLDYMLTTTDLFSIVTPDKKYDNVSLVHYDFRKETNDGAVMLKVEAWFREVRVTGQAKYTKSNSPDAADAQNLGTVQPGPKVTAEFGSAVFKSEGIELLPQGTQ